MQIITDSACDLPLDIVDKLNIDVLPFLIHLDDAEYVDGRTIHPEQIYEAIRDGKQPRTSQVPADSLWETFSNYAEKGISCLYLAFSSQLSGTCSTAKLIAKEVKKRYPKFKITICDTQSGSLGQ